MHSHRNKPERSSSINKELLSSLRRLIRPYARNTHDTDDILQDVLVKVLKNGESIAPAKFMAWLQKVSKTTSIDFYRKNKSSVAEINEEKLSIPNSQIESENLLTKCVRPLIQNLSIDDSQILLAIDLNGESQTELAHKQGLNYSAVKSKVQRARQKLKEEILECCQVELDRRKSPIDVKPKKKSECC